MHACMHPCIRAGRRTWSVQGLLDFNYLFGEWPAALPASAGQFPPEPARSAFALLKEGQAWHHAASGVVVVAKRVAGCDSQVRARGGGGPNTNAAHLCFERLCSVARVLGLAERHSHCLTAAACLRIGHQDCNQTACLHACWLLSCFPGARALFVAPAVQHQPTRSTAPAATPAHGLGHLHRATPPPVHTHTRTHINT